MEFDFKVNPNMTNLRKPSEEIQAEILKDLRSNEQKTIGHMTNERGGRCCLCVMEDTLVRMEGITLDRNFDDPSPESPSWMNVFNSPNPKINGIYLADINDYILADVNTGKKDEFLAAFNVDIDDMLSKSSKLLVRENSNIDSYIFEVMNISHKIIADLIEYTWSQITL